MLFKNCTTYRAALTPTLLSKLEERLASRPFSPCLELDRLSDGFVPVRDQLGLVHVVPGKVTGLGYIALRYCVETKAVPGAALRRLTEQRAQEFAKANGYYPGKKAKKELKDDAETELLRRAIPARKEVDVLISLVDGLLFIDTASAKLAEEIAILLYKIADIKVDSVAVRADVSEALTNWLMVDMVGNVEPTLPEAFVYGDTVDVTEDSDGSTAKYRKVDIAGTEILETIKSGGFRVTQIGFVWPEKFKANINENLVLRGIKGSVLSESGDKDNAEDILTSELWLTGSLLSELWMALTVHLGGWSRPAPLTETLNP